MPCGVVVSIGSQAAEMGATGLELLDHGEQVRNRTGEAIKPDHDQGLARTDLAQHPGQHGAAAVGPGRVLFQDGAAAGGL
jgi:hypothetical protein